MRFLEEVPTAFGHPAFKLAFDVPEITSPPPCGSVIKTNGIRWRVVRGEINLDEFLRNEEPHLNEFMVVEMLTFDGSSYMGDVSLLED